MNYRRNVFLAKPAKFRGRQMMGVVEYPGFHTTDLYGVACAYAHGKVEDLATTEWGATIRKGWNDPMADYPVVVSLVMNGLERLPDFDAFEYYADPVAQLLEEFEHSGEDLTVKGFDEFIGSGFEDSLDNPSDLWGALDQLLMGTAMDRVSGSMRDFFLSQPDPDEALRRAMDDPKDPRLLMFASRQYRYLENVSEHRICAVDYMKPFFGKLLPHWDDPEWESQGWERRVENIEKAGYATVSLTDVYDGRDPCETTNVYSVPPETIIPDRGQELMPWGERKPRVEYHGTSYVNLRRAAPRLMRRLPVPPEPYQGNA